MVAPSIWCCRWSPGGLDGAGVDLEMRAMVESTDLSWRAMGKQVRDMRRVGERVMQGVLGPYIFAGDKELKGSYGRKKKRCIQTPAPQALPSLSSPHIFRCRFFPRYPSVSHDIPRRPTQQGYLFQHGGWKNRKLFLEQRPLMAVMVVC